MTSGSQPAARARPRQQAGAELAVVHLVRQANGIEPLRIFLDSYRRHPAGLEHELVLVFKGFEQGPPGERYRHLAGELDARWLSVPDEGFDLGAYCRAARELPHRRLAFLNSFSVILADDWLKLLAAPALDPGVGAVAASGSWGSHASHTRYNLGLGGPYAGVFADRESTQRVFAELAQGSEEAQAQARGGRVARALRTAGTIARQSAGFAQFPSPHLRTNGLLIERERWLRICGHPPRDKLAAHRLESGRQGITARLRSGAQEVLVAGRDGRAYGCADWPASVTFWQGDQGNLLIGDNQTRSYQLGDALRRQVLSGYAWGERAAPAEPGAPVTHAERTPSEAA
jgi:hypothetical protein